MNMQSQLKLRHYSSSIIKSVYKPINGQDNLHKPEGLWVSNDACPDNWKSWCEDEEFKLENLNCVHDVTLKKNANILLLNTEIEILYFTQKYKDNLQDYGPFTEVSFYILWRKVAEDYQGLIIPDYHWNLRMSEECRWYYPWDCASGCIWDSDAIESITLIEDNKNAVQK